MIGFSRIVSLTVVAFVLSKFCCLSADGDGLERLESKIIRGPTASDLVAYAYQANPSIQVAREAWRAVVERYRIAIALPDPQLLFSYFPEPIETRLGPQDWNVNLSQTIPFPAKLSKAGEIVQYDARIARLGLDKAIRDVIVRILESYHELLYIQEAKKVVALNRDLIEHMRKVGETAYAQDRTTLVDVLKAQSQAAQLMYDALLLEELEQTEKTQLNALMNRPPEAQIGDVAAQPARPLVYDLDAIYQMAVQYQEEILMAETQIEKAQAGIDLAKYENVPDFKLGFFYGAIGHPDVLMPPEDAGRDALGVQFGLSIPMWLGKNAGRLGAARAEAQKARAAKLLQVNDTNAQIRSLYFRLQNAERLIRLYRDELLPQASEALEVAETWFREKQGSFSDFVETQSIYYNFQLSLARAKADYGKYLARLERLVGRSLTESAAGMPETSREEKSK
jgi:cobalt-zinc-cadmium efflux system outer membrane protein